MFALRTKGSNEGEIARSGDETGEKIDCGSSNFI
jgi:hypothetical protein